MKDRVSFSETKKLLQPYLDYELQETGSSLGNSIFDINYIDRFPEDLCENKMDWEEIKDKLTNAHFAVIELLYIIKKLKVGDDYEE